MTLWNVSHAFILSVLQSKYSDYSFRIDVNMDTLFFQKANSPHSYQCPMNDINMTTIDGDIISVE